MTDTEYVPRWQLDAALKAIEELAKQLEYQRDTSSFLYVDKAKLQAQLDKMGADDAD